jgi:hypothetical protein
MLSSHHLYVVYSPYCLYLWLGSQVDLSRRKGALHILKSFLNARLYEQINYRQSYLSSDMNVNNLKFRVELQGYESQRFRTFFSSPAEDRLSYLMMNMKRVAERVKPG